MTAYSFNKILCIAIYRRQYTETLVVDIWVTSEIDKNVKKRNSFQPIRLIHKFISIHIINKYRTLLLTSHQHEGSSNQYEPFLDLSKQLTACSVMHGTHLALAASLQTVTTSSWVLLKFCNSCSFGGDGKHRYPQLSVLTRLEFQRSLQQQLLSCQCCLY